MKIKTLFAAASVFAFSLSLAGGVRADDEKQYTPASVFAGTSWNRLTTISEEQARMFKVCLVRGIYEGAFSVDPQNAYEQYGPWVSFGDLVDALDRFYAQDRNLGIPVTYALVLIAKNPTGPTPQPAEAPAGMAIPRRSLVSMENKN